MEPIKVAIDADAINKMVSEAILNSALGDAVKAAIDREVVKVTRAYDNPLDRLVEQEIARLVGQLLRDEYQETLKKQLSAILAERVTSDLICELMYKALNVEKYR